MATYSYPTDFSSLTWSDLPALAAGDIVDGGGATFTALLTTPTDGTSGNPITWRNFTVTNASGSGVFMTRDYQTFFNVTLESCSGQGMLIQGSDGANHVGLTLRECNFNNNNVDGLRWLVSAAAATSTLTDFEVRDCTFNGNSESGFHIRSQDNANIASIVTRLTVTGNVANDNGSFGFRIAAARLDSAQVPPTATLLARSVDLTFAYNSASGNGNGSVGGGMTIQGFGSSSGDYGLVNIFGNNSSRNNGPAGGLNIFYCQYGRVYSNVCESNTSTIYDANGILIDHENDEMQVFGNQCNDNTLSIATNAGCGIMILDNTNIDVWGNVCDGNNNGLFVGGAGINQSSIVVANNVFTNCISRGMYLDNTFDQPNQLTVNNNVFTGVSGGTHTGIEEEATPTTWAENYNYVHGFTTLGVTLGANSSTADPLLDADGRPESGSPLIAAGTAWWGTRPDGYDGYPFRDAPSIGAYETGPQIFTPDPANDWSEISGYDLVGGDIVEGNGQTWDAELDIVDGGSQTHPITFQNIIIDGADTLIRGIRVNNVEYIDIIDCQCDNMLREGFRVDATTPSTQGHVNIIRPKSDRCGLDVVGYQTIRINAHDVTVTSPVLTNCGDDAIFITSTSGDVTLRNVYIDDVSKVTANGDGIQSQTPGRLTIAGGTIHKRDANKQGVIVTNGTPVISDLTVDCHGFVCDGIALTSNTGAMTGTIDRCTVQNCESTSYFMEELVGGPCSVDVTACIAKDGLEGYLCKDGATVNLRNSNALGISTTCVRGTGTGSVLNVVNCAIEMTGAGNMINIATAGVTYTASNNNYSGNLRWSLQGTPQTTLSGWQTVTGEDATSLSGVTSLKADGEPNFDSDLIAQGTEWWTEGPPKSRNLVPFRSPPTIGAIEPQFDSEYAFLSYQRRKKKKRSNGFKL